MVSFMERGSELFLDISPARTCKKELSCYECNHGYYKYYSYYAPSREGMGPVVWTTSAQEFFFRKRKSSALIFGV